MQTRYFIFLAFVLLAAGGLAYMLSMPKPKTNLNTPCEEYDINSRLLYGFHDQGLDYYVGTIEKNEVLSELLGRFGVPFDRVFDIANKAKDIFPVESIRTGKSYAIVSTDTCFNPDVFVYEPNDFELIHYDLRDSGHVEVIRRDVDTVVQTGAGIIEGSLWVAMQNQGISPELIDRMEDALAWTVDFYHIQKGDRFKLIYESYFIDGKRAGTGKLLAAEYQSGEDKVYSFLFKSPIYDGFYDEQGRPMKKSFLKSPVRYGRISSRYNLRRRHPVRNRVMPHLGTDYAAPRGTPIMAVADGVVTIARFKRNNGNYVKIRHDKNYETQYLHMMKFAKGIKPGKRVKQGETIGYVGKTGLATGYHVCFRFWKNGRQVNHLREKFPKPEPMAATELPAFYALRDSMMQQLDEIYYPFATGSFHPKDTFKAKDLCL